MLDILRHNILTLVTAIEECRDRKQILPCLVLLYSGIDVAASLERSPKEGTAMAFQRWAKNYLISKSNLDCSAKDLYGARCGIIHTFSSSSDYSRSGKAREVIYAWGDASAAKLRAITLAVKKDYIVLDVNELIKVFKNGVDTFFYDLSNDPKRRERLKMNAGKWLANMDKTVIDDVIKILDRPPDT